MKFFRGVLYYLVLMLTLFSWMRCAVPRPPTGGEKDTQGPILLKANPPIGTTRFQAKVITLTFDEFLKQGDVSSALFISPIPKNKPTAFAINKKIKIIWEDALEDSVTYVISLGDAVKDNNEDNPMSQPIQYAFTKGNRLDSAIIGGKITDAYTGKGIKTMTVLLYQPDSILNDNYSGRPALYVTQTDPNGNYKFSFLKKGKYRILAVGDIDQNYQYNLITEKVATPSSDTVIADTLTLGVDLIAFSQDTMPPTVKSVRWLNSRNVILEFSEEIVSAQANESGNTETLKYAYEGKKNQYHYHTLNAYPDTFLLRLSAVTDTAGNIGDTTLKLKFTPPDTLGDRLTIKADAFYFDPVTRSFQINSLLPKDGWQKYVTLTDSSKKVYPIKPYSIGYQIFIPEPEGILDTLRNYELLFDARLTSIDGFKPDSTLSFSVKPASQEGLASLRGEVISSLPQADLLILLTTKDGKKTLQTREKSFFFPNLRPATYNITIIEDWNKDGRWTSGRLFPRRKPEPVYFVPEPVIIKPNWELEGFKLNYPPVSP